MTRICLQMKHLPATLLALSIGGISLIAEQPTNWIANGGFERSARTSNPWTSVTESGAITATPGEANVLAAGGGISDGQAMPVSVSAGDLNADGLQDIALIDGEGYLRVFFNQGSKTAPQFSNPEFASLLLNPKPVELPDIKGEEKKAGNSKTPVLSREDLRRQIVMRSVQRISLADVARTGKLDLLVGTYGGDILLVPNSGTASKPNFKNTNPYEQYVLQKTPERWGNVFSPLAADWNKDNKLDLIIGEGSYSANSIHIFPGKGVGLPTATPEERTTLAYGMGLEQLVPAIADYNGDGSPDLLVAERSGRIAVYLNPGSAWKPGEPLKFHTFITIGGAPMAGLTAKEDGAAFDPLEAIKATNLMNLGGASTISTGDFNGDGLFDLVVGKRSGRVAMALNEGTATAPKFAAPKDIATEFKGIPMFTPSEWNANDGFARGNFGGFITAVKKPAATANATAAPMAVEPAEGNAFLEAGYQDVTPKFFPPPTSPKAESQETALGVTTPNIFMVSQEISKPLQTGKSYTLSFKSRGANVTNGRAILRWEGLLETKAAEIVKGDRGAVDKRGRQVVNDFQTEVLNMPTGSNWMEAKRDIKIQFDNKELASLSETKRAFLTFVFTLAQGSGSLCLDDVKLVEKD